MSVESKRQKYLKNLNSIGRMPSAYGAILLAGTVPKSPLNARGVLALLDVGDELNERAGDDGFWQIVQRFNLRQLTAEDALEQLFEFVYQADDLPF